MPKFQDKTDHEWKLTLDVASIQDVLDETGVNITIVSKDMGWADALFSEPQKLIAVLHVLLAEQVAELKLSPRDFARRFDGPTLERAGDALMAALVCFSHRARVAEKILALLPEMTAKAEDRAIQMLDQMRSTASNSATSSPGNSDSIPEG